MPIEKRCEICGKVFVVPPVRVKSAKTCSLECRGKLIAKQYAEKRVKRICPGCGKTFDMPACHAERRIYCSDKCANRSRTTHKNHHTGEQHYRWNGGTYHHDGYRYLRMPEHPYAGAVGYVFEHRIVMETWMREIAPTHPFLVNVNGIGYLHPDIQVHHIGSKSDNRRSKLLACTATAHREIHNGKAPMQGEVWPEIEGLKPYEPRHIACNCAVCGVEFVKKLCDVKRGSGVFYCSRRCYDARSRKPFGVTFA